MHELVVVLQGLMLGIGIAAPVGPIGLLCIRRTLQHGPLTGFATGMGAAFADTFFGAIAAFGVSAAIGFLSGHDTAFKLIGGIVVLAVAVRTFQQPPPVQDGDNAREPDRATALAGFMTGLSLTLTNPATIMAFVAVFAGFGLGADLSAIDAGLMVGGVFIGSSIWWLTLSSVVASVRHRISNSTISTINHCTGIALAVFGVWAVGSGLLGIAQGFVNGG